MNYPPFGVHQGAQCDRASLALNYHQQSMNFFYPQVHETRCVDGHVSCEMPLPPYLAAICYKLFGFNHLWYRLLSYLFFIIGVVSLFLLLSLYLNKFTSAILIGIIWSSPILTFYSNSFLPDTFSFGLIGLAWFYFFKLFVKHHYLPAYNLNIKNISIFILSISFACSIKTTSFIHLITMILSVVISKKLWINQPKKTLYKIFILSLIFPFSWILWNTHLKLLFGDFYFLQKIPISNNLQEFKEAFLVYFYNWPQELLSIELWWFQITVFVFVIISIIVKRTFLNSLSLILLLGSIAFMILMMQQFKYHDYYIITISPIIVFSWVSLFESIKLRKFRWLRISLFVILIPLFIIQLNLGKKRIEQRYEVGNYWEQSSHNPFVLNEIQKTLRKNNIGINDCVLVGFDGGPNNMLYLLNVRGFRVSKEHHNKEIKEFIINQKPKAIVSNDSAFNALVQQTDSNFVMKMNRGGYSLFLK